MLSGEGFIIMSYFAKFDFIVCYLKELIPWFGEKEQGFLLLITRNFVVSVRRSFLLLSVPEEKVVEKQ